MATPQPELNYCQDQSHEGQKHHLLQPFYSKDIENLAILHDYKHHASSKLAKVCFLKSRVAQSVAFDPHDFKDEMDG